MLLLVLIIGGFLFWDSCCWVICIGICCWFGIIGGIWFGIMGFD